MDDDQGFDKTEEPTEKKLQDAYKEGKIPKSAEVNTWCVLAASGISIIYLLPKSMSYLSDVLSAHFARASYFQFTSSSVQNIGYDLISSCSFALMYPIALIFCAALFSGYAQTYRAIGWQNIKPNFSKLNPLKGFKNIISFKSILEMFKSLLKTILLAGALYIAFSDVMSTIPSWINLSINGATYFFVELLEKLFFTTLMVFLIITGGDFWYQRLKFYKEMKMTKQEVKDETKQSEGDPEIKSRIRGIRMKRYRAMLKKAVKEADVIITNPEHYAVALKWHEEKMRAPIVTAKGMDFLALLIKEIAKEFKIPIVEKPPVARALYKSIEINQEIHPDQYQAVAEILRGVAQLKQRQF